MEKKNKKRAWILFYSNHFQKLQFKGTHSTPLYLRILLSFYIQSTIFSEATFYKAYKLLP